MKQKSVYIGQSGYLPENIYMYVSLLLEMSWLNGFWLADISNFGKNID